MTSPAIKLARKCGAVYTETHDGRILLSCTQGQMKQLVAKAQAQALRTYADETYPEWSSDHKMMYDAADEMEGK